MLNVKQAKAVLVFAFAPSLSLKSVDQFLQPNGFSAAAFTAKPHKIISFLNAFHKEGHPHNSEEEEGHPLEEENDVFACQREKILSTRKRSRKE